MFLCFLNYYPSSYMSTTVMCKSFINYYYQRKIVLFISHGEDSTNHFRACQFLYITVSHFLAQEVTLTAFHILEIVRDQRNLHHHNLLLLLLFDFLYQVLLEVYTCYKRQAQVISIEDQSFVWIAFHVHASASNFCGFRALFTELTNFFFSLKMDHTALFTHLKIILLQCFGTRSLHVKQMIGLSDFNQRPRLHLDCITRSSICVYFFFFFNNFFSGFCTLFMGPTNLFFQQNFH